MRHKLIEMRTKAELSRAEVATQLGITERYYHHIEAGKRTGNVHIWDRLEALFGIPQRELRKNS